MSDILELGNFHKVELANSFYWALEIGDREIALSQEGENWHAYYSTLPDKQVVWEYENPSLEQVLETTNEWYQAALQRKDFLAKHQQGTLEAARKPKAVFELQEVAHFRVDKNKLKDEVREREEVTKAMDRKRFEVDELIEIYRLKKRGLTFPRIAQEMNRSESAIYAAHRKILTYWDSHARLNSYNEAIRLLKNQAGATVDLSALRPAEEVVRPSGVNWLPAETIAQIYFSYQAGKSTERIASETGFSSPSIANALRYLRIDWDKRKKVKKNYKKALILIKRRLAGQETRELGEAPLTPARPTETLGEEPNHFATLQKAFANFEQSIGYFIEKEVERKAGQALRENGELKKEVEKLKEKPSGLVSSLREKFLGH